MAKKRHATPVQGIISLTSWGGLVREIFREEM
jgi:hypothetical protein